MAALAGAVFSGGGAARATAPIAIDLAFEVESDARGCPDAEAFRASVRRQLGYDPFASGADRKAVVSIAHKANGFDGRIQWNDAGGRWAGERRLSSRKSDCTSLAQDLAFSVAVQVQLLATLAPVESKPSTGQNAPVVAAAPSSRRQGAAAPSTPASSLVSSAPSPSPAPPQSAAALAAAPEPIANQAPSSTRDESAGDPKAAIANVPPPASQTQASGSSPGGVSLWVGFGPAVAWGLAPQSNATGRLFVDARGSRLSIELGIDAAWPVTHQEARVGGFRLIRGGGTLAGCGHVHVLLGCVLGTVGVLQAHGEGVDAPGSPTGAFYQVGGRLGARFDFGSRYFAGARVDGLWSPSPWTIEVNGVPMWTTPRLGALVGVDVGAIFF